MIDIITCKICNKVLNDKKSLASHSRAAHHLTTEEYNNLYKSIKITDDMIQCKLCDKYFLPLGMPNHLSRKHNIKVIDYYNRYYKLENEGKCVICGKSTSFMSLTKGYRIHCSSKCSQNDVNVKNKILPNIIKYDNDFKNTDFCLKKPHVYRYDFDYNGEIYHYVGSTINSQLDRTYNHINGLIKLKIDKIGRKEFLIKYCTIVKWFNANEYIVMTDFEELLNKQVKQEFGEQYVLSIGDGRKPSKNCIEAAVISQKKNGSWNKNKHLSEKHKQSISEGLKQYNKNISITK